MPVEAAQPAPLTVVTSAGTLNACEELLLLEPLTVRHHRTTIPNDDAGDLRRSIDVVLELVVTKPVRWIIRLTCHTSAIGTLAPDIVKSST